MKQYIKTSWYYHIFKEDHSSTSSDSNSWNDGIWEKNRWTVNHGSLKEGLEGLSKYCNENNFEIKSMMPFDRAQSYEYGASHSSYAASSTSGWGYGWGLGKGWGISMTDGFAVMLQSIEMLSDEEYEERVANDKRMAKLAAEIEDISKEITQYEKNIQNNEEKIKQLNQNIKLGIVEKTKGLFKKKITYMVGEKEFSDSGLSQRYINEMISDVERLNEKNKSSKVQVDSLNKKLSEL